MIKKIQRIFLVQLAAGQWRLEWGNEARGGGWCRQWCGEGGCWCGLVAGGVDGVEGESVVVDGFAGSWPEKVVGKEKEASEKEMLYNTRMYRDISLRASGLK
nr:hypothetical protein [Tanacetum cinerariifolium]